jgi:hypothetical protein
MLICIQRLRVDYYSTAGALMGFRMFLFLHSIFSLTVHHCNNFRHLHLSSLLFFFLQVEPFKVFRSLMAIETQILFIQYIFINSLCSSSLFICVLKSLFFFEYWSEEKHCNKWYDLNCVFQLFYKTIYWKISHIAVILKSWLGLADLGVPGLIRLNQILNNFVKNLII